MSDNQPRRNAWFIFFLICVPIFIGSVDLTSIVVVLPQATLDLLGPKGINKADQALWAVTAYLLAYTVSLVLVGRLSDILPRKQIFLVCSAIFIIGSIWAGFATELPLSILQLFPIWPEPEVLPLISLVLGRIVQAIGAGASVSVGMALVSDIFPPDHRAEAISLIGAIDSLGWVIGNLYAGLILQVLPTWRYIFLINAGVALIALIMVWWALRNTRTVGAGGSYDLRGAVIFAGSLIALTIGIETLREPTSASILLLISLGLLILFVWLQRRTKNALFDMHFINQPEVRAALITNLIIGFGLILMVAGVPLMINLRSLFLRGESLLTGALRAGIMLSALTLPLIVAVLVGEARYRRVGAAVPVSLGLILGIIGFIAASLWTYTVPGFVIAIPLALVGVGLGLTIGPLSLVVIDAAEPSERGLASSLVLMMRLLGMTIGTPLAATVTLYFANEWATERVASMTTFRDIARSMLIPPMATDALARVMLTGVVACGIGLFLFYLPRARKALLSGMGVRAIFAGSALLTAIVIFVGALAAWDSATTPTILHNPIAQQLPPNVTFYAALNIQQLFLKNTERPLQAVLDAIGKLSSSSQQPSQEPSIPTEPTEPITPAEPASPTSPLDNIVRDLFQAKQWNINRYKAFCSDDRPQELWQDCFTGGLLSWVGPQAAFALLPRTRADQDYLFAFQATNRNNAIQWATNLAAALGESEPVEYGPNIRILTINEGQPNERRLAITQAYVLIGTPKAIQYTLNHGELSLADHPDFKAVRSQLPDIDFATLYLRSSNFEADLRPSLERIFERSVLESFLQLASDAAKIGFTRNSIAPTLLGVALRVDEQQLTVDAVANVPFSLQRLNASPVPTALLNLVPEDSTAWTAINLNVAGLIRDVNISQVLGQVLPAGPIAELVSRGLGQSLQNLLTYAQGQLLITVLPESDPVSSSIALIMPMVDKEDVTLTAAVDAVRQELQTLGTLSLGLLAVDTQPAADQHQGIVTVKGRALQSILPQGFQFTLTKDNKLVIVTGERLAAFLATLATQESSNNNAFNAVPLEPSFLYAFLDPAQDIDLTATIGGTIKRSAFHLKAVFRAEDEMPGKQ